MHLLTLTWFLDLSFCVSEPLDHATEYVYYKNVQNLHEILEFLDVHLQTLI